MGAEMERNFFQKMETRWEDVHLTEDGGIPTKTFLAAAKGLIGVFDLLGSVAFHPVKADMNKNVHMVETRFNLNPERFNTLQKLVVTEKEDKVTATENATTSLMWFKRGLEFVSATFDRSLANHSEELEVSFTEAYGKTLKKHHNFFVAPIFALAMKATPYRKDFYAKLGHDQEALHMDMVSYFHALKNIVAVLVKFYKDIGMEK